MVKKIDGTTLIVRLREHQLAAKMETDRDICEPELQSTSGVLCRFRSLNEVSSFHSSALIPSLPSTYSVPTAPERPLTPHGDYVLSGHDDDLDSLSRALPQNRSHFLEKARKLLSEVRLPGSYNTPFSPPSCCDQEGRNISVDALFTGEMYAVKFVWSQPANRSVFLAGDFNSWGLPVSLTRRANDVHPGGNDMWETVLRLPKGQYHYKYVVDGEWQYDDSTAWVDERDRGRVNILLIEPVGR